MDQTTIDMLIAGIQSHNWLLVVCASLFITGSVVVSITHALGKQIPVLDVAVNSLKTFLTSKKPSEVTPTTPAAPKSPTEPPK